MTEMTKLDIALLLPAVPDARDACVRRLGDILTAKKGIETAHLVDTSQGGVSQICVHFDPDQLSIGEVRELALTSGIQAIVKLPKQQAPKKWISGTDPRREGAVLGQ